MTAVTGRPLQSLTLTPRQERHAYAQAGALLARFHDTAPRTVMSSFGTDRAAYIRTQLADGTGPLTAADLTVPEEALHVLESLPAQQAQPSHLDFTSRNILWDTGAGVIGFETSRNEAVGRDFLRITQRTLYHRPDLRTAFFQGYGREPDQAEAELMRICTATDAAAIVVTATARRQRAFAYEARTILTAAVRTWPDPPPGTTTPHRPVVCPWCGSAVIDAAEAALAPSRAAEVEKASAQRSERDLIICPPAGPVPSPEGGREPIGLSTVGPPLHGRIK